LSVHRSINRGTNKKTKKTNSPGKGGPKRQPNEHGVQQEHHHERPIVVAIFVKAITFLVLVGDAFGAKDIFAKRGQFQSFPKPVARVAEAFEPAQSTTTSTKKIIVSLAPLYGNHL